jgi:hypothetical protein
MMIASPQHCGRQITANEWSCCVANNLGGTSQAPFIPVYKWNRNSVLICDKIIIQISPDLQPSFLAPPLSFKCGSPLTSECQLMNALSSKDVRTGVDKSFAVPASQYFGEGQCLSEVKQHLPTALH